MKRRPVFTILSLGFVLTACISSQPGGMDMVQEDHDNIPNHDQMESQVMGMMNQDNMQAMRARHNTAVPEEYAGLTNPIEADQTSLEKGEELYTTLCISCHGESGLGDGLASEALSPPPAPIALSSQMIEEDYWLWRVSEGGLEFGTTMPAWKGALNQEDIWNLLNYVKTLGN